MIAPVPIHCFSITFRVATNQFDGFPIVILTNGCPDFNGKHPTYLIPEITANLDIGQAVGTIPSNCRQSVCNIRVITANYHFVSIIINGDLMLGIK